MLARQRPSRKKLVIALSIIAGLALLIGSASVLYASAPRNLAASHPKSVVLSGGMSSAPVRAGEVNLATLPKATASDKAAAAASAKQAKVKTNRPLKTPAQLSTYQQWVLTHPAALPHGTGQPAPAGASRAPNVASPNFVGGGTVPQLVNQADGISFTQSGCSCTPPDQAIAASPGYVFEGVNNLLEVYTPNYAKVFGPWTAATFFAPIAHIGASFSDPQITFDAERTVYLISWLEIVPSGNDYIDLAISKTSTPSPLGNFLEYSIPATITGASDFCDYDTLGYDYWTMWVTCATFAVSNSAFLGNRAFYFSIDNMLTNTLGGHFGWFSNVPTNLNCGGGCTPAYRLSPTIEDGMPNAEWITATNAGFGVWTNNLTLCAITNTHAIVGGSLPRATCDFNAMPLAYGDPIKASQPGFPQSIDPGLGTKQVMYRGGRLYFAMPLALSGCSASTVDGIYWADVVPQLTNVNMANPQVVNGLVSAYSENGYFCYNNDADAYMPTLAAGNEGDAALVFNYSSASVDPSIVWTGRMAADAPGTMGQNVAPSSFFVVVGISTNTTGRWGDYSACALTIDPVTRSTLFCGGEYGGADVWNTRLYQLRME